MAEINKPRCIRIISDMIAGIADAMEQHTDVVEYDDIDAMLQDHVDMSEDKEALIGLKEFLEEL